MSLKDTLKKTALDARQKIIKDKLQYLTAAATNEASRGATSLTSGPIGLSEIEQEALREHFKKENIIINFSTNYCHETSVYLSWGH